MKLTAILIIFYLSFTILFTAYLAVMNLKRSKEAGTLAKPVIVVMYPIFILGYLLDVLFNWIFGTIMFIDIPRELTLSSRLNRHYQKDTWRGELANYICATFLNPFDAGHCHVKK